MGQQQEKQERGIVRPGHGRLFLNSSTFYEKKIGFLMPFHPLTNFEIQKYDHNEPRFISVYSRDNLSETKDGTCVINLDELIGVLCTY